MFSNPAANATTGAKGGLGSGSPSTGNYLAQLFGGLFGNGGGGYDDAMKEFEKYMQQAMQGYQPYQQAGQNAINPFQKRMQEMSDPTAFYKNMMSGYQESPLAQNQQRAGMQAATNMGSATGMTGSTPMMQQAQQNAQNISSQDMGNYFNNLSGINQQYTGGLQNLMGQGMNAQNGIAGLLAQLAQGMGQGAYGKAQGQQQNLGDIFGGLFGSAGNFFGF